MNIKRLLLFVNISVVLIFAVFIFLSLQKKNLHTSDRYEEVRRLPTLKFKVIKSGTKNSGRMEIINFFDPNCEMCKNMAEKIASGLLTNSKFNLTMLSNADSTATSKFISLFKLDQLPAVTIGCDTARLSIKLFQANTVPSYFIYNTQGTLVNLVYGELSVNQHLKMYNE